MTDRLPAFVRRYRSLKAVQPGPNQARLMLTAALFAGTAARLFRRLRRPVHWYRIPRPDRFDYGRETEKENSTTTQC